MAERQLHRRVYKAVAVAEGNDGAQAVLLDGKPALTPLRAPLASPARRLAEAVASEWQAQNPHIDPETMPLTRLLATQIDRVAPQRDAVIGNLLAFVDADSICYRTSHPADLCERQHRLWQPVIDWLMREHGLALTTVVGAMPAAQAAETAAQMRREIAALNDAELTAFQAVAALASSLALAFALVRRRLTAAEVFDAALLDELHQAERWGEDSEAAARRRRIADDLAAIERYLELSKL